MVHVVHLALGSSISHPVYLFNTLEMLRRHLTMLALSSFYEALSAGNRASLNAVAVLLATHSTPQQLKEHVLLPLEVAPWRDRTADKPAPHPVALDILAWDGEILNENIFRYAHLAVPLAEILRHFPLRHANRRIRLLAKQFQHCYPLVARSPASLRQSLWGTLEQSSKRRTRGLGWLTRSH